MKFTFSSEPASKVRADLLLVPIFGRPATNPVFRELDPHWSTGLREGESQLIPWKHSGIVGTRSRNLATESVLCPFPAA